MRILVVTPTFVPTVGGAETGICEIYKRLGRRHQVRILTVDRGERTAYQQVDDVYYKNMNFEVCYFKDIFDVIWSKFPKVVKELLPPFSVFYVTSTAKHIKSFRPDVINFHFVVPGGLSLILIRLLTKIPVALSLIGRPDVFGVGTTFFRIFRSIYMWMVIKSASSVISISKYCLHLFPGNKEFEKIIPYGVDIDRFSPRINGEEIKVKLGIARETKVLFALQRLSEVKRVDVLIRSLKYILGANKEVVLVIGGKGRQSEPLKALAKELNVEDNVIFAGYISEQQVPGYFAMSDIFTFSSPNETFGIVLAQAMASGKPIVAVNATSIPYVVDDGETGTLVDSLDPKEFAKAIIELLDNKDVLSKYSENGRRKAVEKYNWDVITEQYECVFRELAER